MGLPVANNAMIACSFGVSPTPLTVLPTGRVLMESQPAATIMDHVPAVNIKPFGMCSSLANPTVAAATATALGVLTPMPCVPVTTTPWAPGSPTVLIASMPALTATSKCMCTWGGIIQITYPGTTTEQVP